MRAGVLRHRITIQCKRAPISMITNTFGEERVAQDEAWESVGTFWGAVEPLSGREYLEQRQQASAVTTRIRLRYQGNVTIKPAMRALARDKIYDIEAVINWHERDRELVLMCRENPYA